jgi:hypothetical protein
VHFVPFTVRLCETVSGAFCCGTFCDAICAGRSVSNFEQGESFDYGKSHDDLISGKVPACPRLKRLFEFQSGV